MDILKWKHNENHNGIRKLFTRRAVFTIACSYRDCFSHGKQRRGLSLGILGFTVRSRTAAREKACSKAVLLSQLQETCNKVHGKAKRKCSQSQSSNFTLKTVTIYQAILYHHELSLTQNIFNILILEC